MVLDASQMENKPAKVLILDTAWLGDVLFTTSLIGAARASWPEAKIDALTAKRGRDLLLDHPYLNKLWVYDKQERERGISSLFSLGKQLAAEQYDVVLCAHPSSRSRLLTWLTKAPVRVGYHGFLASRAFTHSVRNSLAVEPDHVERRIDLLRAIEPNAHPAPLLVGIGNEDIKWASEELAELGVAPNTALALIPGSARLTKQWGIERFLELARLWIQDSGQHVIVFGGPQERDLLSAAREARLEKLHVISESLGRTSALLSLCKCAVGNDTGVSFLAIASGCPKVCLLYGSTQVNYNFPAPHKAIAAGVPCCLPRTGHGQAKCKWTGGEPWCMGEIGVERVWGEIAEEKTPS